MRKCFRMRTKFWRLQHFVAIISLIVILVLLANRTFSTEGSSTTDEDPFNSYVDKRVSFTKLQPKKSKSVEAKVELERESNKKEVEQKKKSSESKSKSKQVKFESTVEPGPVVSEQDQPNTNQTCKLVRLQANDTELDKFFKEVQPIKCENENWVYTENGKLYIDKKAIDRHGDIKCECESINRDDDHHFETIEIENCKSGTPLLTDFFRVKCEASDSTYSNVHATVVATEKTLKRIAFAKPLEKSLNLNVYMLGFDTLSRTQLIRMLPKTYEYLTKDLNGILLEGYNIVGDGTPQALIPMFTGKTEIELPLTRKRYKNASYVDVYPFVWKEFAKAGYVTMYAEDAPKFGVFQYRLKGFNVQPTDHYLRTFYLAEDKTTRYKYYCIGAEPHHKVHFDYSINLWKNYAKTTRKFAFSFHAILSHDDLNMVGAADDDMVDHLKFFNDNGHLNDSILIFMSDHGPRFNELRETQRGKLEERLPAFVVVLPSWFASKYPKAVDNLRTNAARLTTPFDIHPTLQSLLNFEYPPKKAEVSQRGISLFEEIPKERTCHDAGVELHWCSCLTWKTIDVDNERIQLIARKLVDRINAETKPERGLCSELKLAKVELAQTYQLSDDLLRFVKSKDTDGFVPDLSGKTNVTTEYYRLNVRTMPGNALYETSITWNVLLDDTSINLNDVSHINKYGDLPHCIIDQNYFLAKWCVCYDKI